MQKNTKEKKFSVAFNDDFEYIMKYYYDGKERVIYAEKVMADMIGSYKNSSDTKMWFATSDVNNQLTGAVMDEYFTGYKMMDDAKHMIANKLAPYIRYIIKNYFYAYEKFYADFFQESMLSVLKGIDSYTPGNDSPVMFFTSYIFSGIFTFLSDNMVTQSFDTFK